MERMHEQDTLISHRILNYLHAGYQGEYTYLRVLQDLGSPEISDQALQRVEQNLERIKKWYGGLSKGDCLFSANWKKAETFEAKKALELLDALRLIAERSALILREIGASDDWGKSIDKTRKAVANVARSAYSSNAYTEALIDLARISNNTADLKNYEALLQSGKAELDRVHACISIVKQERKIPEGLAAEFIKDLHRAAGALSSQAHDVIILLAAYNGGDAYIANTFKPEELQTWRQAGFSAIPAGYWRAYGVAPKDAAVWAHHGIDNPGVVTVWHVAGFDASAASQWTTLGISPDIASKWRDAGYQFTDAAGYIKKGYITPESLPKGE